MSLSDESTDPTPPTRQDSRPGFEDTEPAKSMNEFYQLYQGLLLITLVLTGIIFISVWIFYSLNIALSYLLGACTGLVYLRMLAKDVERLSPEKQWLSKTRFALLVVVFLLASRWNQLQVMPVVLGFLTYKATLAIYLVREQSKSDLPKFGQP
ncbi:MAG: ATP synthase subunit I [Scytonema sp. RU_4_4]|nr:ATP synthase subunit I [Scytonema sp. RU_4_4]